MELSSRGALSYRAIVYTHKSAAMNNFDLNINLDNIDVDLSDGTEYRPDSMFGASAAQVTVEFQQTGKQNGHIIIPFVDKVTNLKRLRVPVCLIKGQHPGPVITIIAGIHGDEYEGSVAIRRLARDLSHEQLHGSLILLPSVNYRGLYTGSRNNPLDNQNLDTAFPGRADGSPSEQLAFQISQHFIQASDLLIDLRSGGRQLKFIPSAAVRFDENTDRQSRCEEAMIAFGAPNSLRLPASSHGSGLQATVRAMHKDYMQTELGGAMTYGPQLLSIAHTGCLNVLRHRGMLKDDLQLASTRLLEVRDDSYYVYADTSGILEPLTYLGDNVWKEQAMANILPPESQSTAFVPVYTQRQATLIASHCGGYVNEGDLIAILAEEVQT